jgi:Putative MetA-pathway of phenol degradation
MSRPRATAILVILAGLIQSGSTASAQDLEPRAYAASPVGVSFLAVIAGHSTGGVVIDPSLPIEDVRASVNSLGIGVGRVFDLFGHTALAVAALPFAWAEATGRVGETTGQASRSGLADPRIKLSVNLVGGRALSVTEFARTHRPTIMGVSLTAIPPLGQYDRTKLVNLGANRWAFKPEIGVSRLIAKWTIDGYAGVWMATANDEFYPGESRRTQRPIVALQAHVSYTARPRLWIAGDGTWYSGGRTTVDGVEKADLQRNTRLGVTVSLPIARQQSLKVSASTGAATRIGSDFKTIAVAWQVSWFH